MKKVCSILTVALGLSLLLVNPNVAQNNEGNQTQESAETSPMEEESNDTTAVDTTASDTTAASDTTMSGMADGGDEQQQEADQEQTFHQVIKDYFIEGNPRFMSLVLICLILGLAVSIERIITLNLATTNTDKLLRKVEDALNSGGVEEAKEVTKNTRGPVASIFSQGMMRITEGIEMVEKSIMAYGSVEMGRLERGLTWISLFISIAPMLGFMGTVIGMIQAFDSIEAAGSMSPQLVAGGIKTALLTTVSGLIVAIILQVFYNYCVSKVDSIVNNMEDASIALVDLLVKHKLSTGEGKAQ